MRNLVFVKLGGSLITDKSEPFSLRTQIIQRLAREIHKARQSKDIKLIIGHGGGSFPHVPAKKYETHKGLINENSYEGLAKVQDAAARLNRIVVSSLINAGEWAFSIQPSSATVTKNGRIAEWYTKPIELLLNYDMIPVPYGDVGLDTFRGCSIISTEEIFNFLARKFKPERILLCGKVDGVFTADPSIDPKAELIPEITTKNYAEIKKWLTTSDGIDITGGMLHKVERMLELTKLGIKSEIINGFKQDCLRRSLLGEIGLGTVIKT